VIERKKKQRDRKNKIKVGREEKREAGRDMIRTGNWGKQQRTAGR
jgi:hypothetical protein